MAGAISDIEKSKRGRPRTDSTPVMVRLLPEQLTALDAWIEGQEEPRPSRPEAIRQLIDKALS